MQRLILTLLAAISLLLGVFAAIGSQPAPAQADTTIPAYGAPDYLDGSPVGGGTGYSQIYSAADSHHIASTATQLKTALAAASSGDIVYVADGAEIIITSTTPFSVPPGVIVAAGRGASSVPGKIRCPSALSPASYAYAVNLGTGARATGLIIEGGESGVATSSNPYNWSGIIAAANTQIDNCEIYGMAGGQAIACDGQNIWVHHNYLHHCQNNGYASGYGICIGSSCTGTAVLAEGNVFDYHKHCIAGGAGRASWIFRYNYLGTHCIGGQIDSHGQNDGTANPAGDVIEIYNNTSEFASGNAFIQIRGIPYTSVSVHHNWTYQSSTYTYYGGSNWGYAQGIGQIMTSVSGYGYNAPNQGSFVKMTSHDNWYGTTAPPSTNVAPVLSAIGNRSIGEGATLSFTISASDANGDALTYSASNSPVGASFDAATRTFSWTPGFGQSGTYTNVHFQVSDGILTDSEDMTITVTASSSLQGDVNGDGAVNSLDMIRVGQHWNETGGSGWIREDINGDATVNVLDATLVGQHWTG